MRKYRNQVLAGLAFISVVLIAVVVITGADALAARLRDFPLWVFVPVFGLKCLNWSLRYLEWRYFLGVINVRTVPGGENCPAPSPDAPATIRERDSVILWAAGMTLSISPGKLAEVLKALVLKNLIGTEFSRSAPVIFMERLVDGLAVIFLAAVSMLFVAGTLTAGDLSITYVRAVLVVTTLALVIGIVLLRYRPLALWLLDRTGRWPGVRHIQSPLRTLYDSSYDLLRLRHLGLMTGVGFGAYFTDCIGFYLLLTGLGVDGSWTLFGQASFILGFSVIIAALSAMPGGAGGRELTIGAMLTGIVGLSKANAGTATFLISIFQVWIGVLIGLVFIALFRHILFPPSLEAEIAAYEAARQTR
ncbi:MAG: flippase-like domain-containing protein [Anaerolineae bacterium]|nr:flippase-like domain-containing protein [Anaerolineae bacterium]